MKRVLFVFAIFASLAAHADLCTEEKEKAGQEYDTAISELKAQVLPKSNGDVWDADKSAREFYSELRYMKRDFVEYDLNNAPKQARDFETDPMKALKDKAIKSKLEKAASLHGMEFKVDKGNQIFVCTKDLMSNKEKTLTIKFCDTLDLPSFSAQQSDWGAPDYIRNVVHIVEADDGSKGKVYKGVDLRLTRENHVFKHSRSACKKRVVEGARSQQKAVENDVPAAPAPKNENSVDQ